MAECVAARRSGHKARALYYGVEYEPIDSQRVYERDGWRCQLCRRKVNKVLKYPHPRSASLDHAVPMSQGGSHVYANVQLAHWDCNIRKGIRGTDQLALIG